MKKVYLILSTFVILSFLFWCINTEVNNTRPVMPSDNVNDDFSEQLKNDISANEFISKLNDIETKQNVKVKVNLEEQEGVENNNKQIEKINSFFSKDNEHVYFTTPYTEFNIIEWADVETFQVLEDWLKAKDKNYTYVYKDLLNWVYGEKIVVENNFEQNNQNDLLNISVGVDCSKYDINICNQIDECRICPPCEECSSISCQQNSFCEWIWFTQEWSDNFKKSNNRN